MKFRYTHIFMFLMMLISSEVFGQMKESISLSIEDAFKMAEKNSEQLMISRKSVDIAEQRVQVTALQRLPFISTSLNYGYLSNSQIWTPDFSSHSTAMLPHHLTQLSLQSTQVIFKGGEIRGNVERSMLEKDYSTTLDEKELVDIKLSVAVHYLDIFNLLNQRQVLNNNLGLAEKRLNNILAMQSQGMLTNNDVLRTRLQISDLKTAIGRNDNLRRIRNNQLNMILGLDEQVLLIPDSTLLLRAIEERRTAVDLNGLALQHSQKLRLYRIDTAISRNKLKTIKADRYPEILLFAGSNFQRPFLNSVPAIDIYSNVWQAGITIKYNISSIYQSPRKIKEGRLNLEQSIINEKLQSHRLSVEISNAYLSYKEAEEELVTFETDQLSAKENYRIVEKKYFNQLSLLTDIIDAANTKTEAELKVSNARIRIILEYFQLLRTIGTL